MLSASYRDSCGPDRHVSLIVTDGGTAWLAKCTPPVLDTVAGPASAAVC